jgi:pSer/pThr/pTyr-binding forkhead associated (FHA) protein
VPKISVYRGRTHLFDHWIEKTEVVIGRSAEAEVPLDSPAASRRHCRIVRRQGAYFLEELGAKNGLFVNGKFCNIKRLEDGDRIEIADHILAFSRPRSEVRQEQAIASNQAGAAFRIGNHDLDRMMKGDGTGKGDSLIVRQEVATASSKDTTAVSPEELQRLMVEMQKKLKAHVEVLSPDGRHIRTALEETTYLVGFNDVCDIHLGPRTWPWGKLAAKIHRLPDKSHRLQRMSKWVGIKVNADKLTGVHILADRDVVTIGGVKLRYLGRAEIGMK